MHADADAGEMPGWLQAPFVVERDGVYHMFYGNGTAVCQATSSDGIDFKRRFNDAGVTAIYSDGSATRDPMVLRDGDRWIAYTSAAREGRNGIYARTSNDLETWSEPTLVSEGGRAGHGPESAECPFVIYRPEVGLYYLFRNQLYGENARNTVYASPDPMNFGVDDDRYFVTELPIAAPEIASYKGETYIVALRDTLDGIHIAHLSWR
jgi:sucrose-6-phosphate hydrolase SacC (GH32 family)